MLDIRENISLKGKTTMRIGGTARYYAELETKEDVEQAVAFAQEHNLPLIMLGGGSNTIFADGTINALVVRITASNVEIFQANEANEASEANAAVQSGKNLPQLINELADQGLDLSPLTGILGTVGGAIFGNAGQGPKGIWIDTYVESVDAYIDEEWKTLTKEECDFSYRESWFKSESRITNSESRTPPIIWSTTLKIPRKDPIEIEAEIQRLLQRRLETQPHVKTAGSCFKAVGDRPAWQLIDEAGLRDTKSGGVHISEKHANFLINDGNGTFQDALDVTNTIQQNLAEHPCMGAIEVEMRFVQEDGSLEF